MRDAYGQALVRLGEANPAVVVLDADLANSVKTDLFGKRFPDRFFAMGIAEQNMLSVAAGMATAGLIPIVTSFAVFAVVRALDQIRTSVAQPGLPVKIVGGYSGLLTSRGGCTHTAIEDIALTRALPGMTVIAPGDALEAAQVTELLPEIPGPVYVRLARGPVPDIFPAEYRFRPGKAVTLRTGGDVALICTGTMTGRALQAADALSRRGIAVEVLHVPTIKPLDVDAVVAAAARCRLVVTAEEHNIIGGLGSAVAECLAEHLPTRMRRIGVADRWGESGADDPLLAHFGVDAAGIERQVAAALDLRRS